jgi:hypothetical protein
MFDQGWAGGLGVIRLISCERRSFALDLLGHVGWVRW